MHLRTLIAGVVVVETGTITHWYADGLLHSDGDLPAVVASLWFGRIKMWYARGLLHRASKPAVKYCHMHGSVITEHYCNGILQTLEGVQPMNPVQPGDTARFEWGRLHCSDGPAIVRANGDREWWHCGIRHRAEQSPVYRVEAYLTWRRYSVCYTPSTIYNSNLEYPAIEYANGDKRWFHEGREGIYTCAFHTRVALDRAQCYMSDLPKDRARPSMLLANGRLLWFVVRRREDTQEPAWCEPAAAPAHYQFDRQVFDGVPAGTVCINGVIQQ